MANCLLLEVPILRLISFMNVYIVYSVSVMHCGNSMIIIPTMDDTYLIDKIG